jgi:hypothetical protein
MTRRGIWRKMKRRDLPTGKDASMQMGIKDQEK